MGETEEAHHSSIDPPEGVDSPGCDGLIAGPLADTTACTFIESPENPKHTMIYLNHICSGSQVVSLKDMMYFCVFFYLGFMVFTDERMFKLASTYSG